MPGEANELRDLLRERDLRLTPQREAVLDVLLQNRERHMTAEDIYAETRDSYPEIGLATVYRTLELFVDLGLVSRLDLGQGGARFEYAAREEQHYHHHMICLGCGKITEFDQDLLEDVERKATKETGFQITDHSLRFYGYCPECQKNRAGK
jgi:Fur family ferric uptake transcriptional regulator